MILYATKQTIDEFNIPMPEELSSFNNILANQVIKEQSNDDLLKWGIKIFYFDGQKCLQAINFASKLTIFIFDLSIKQIACVGDYIARYLLEIYDKDIKMQKILKILFNKYPVCAFSKLTDKSIISSLNHNQTVYAGDGYSFYEYIDKNILKTVEINKDFNWKYLSSKVINGKREYIYPAEYFRELIIDRYG